MEDNSQKPHNFGCLRPLPSGWAVYQLDSGHFYASDGRTDSCITWNPYRARRFAFQLAKEQP
jgi:hypothetical protein